MKHYPTLLRGRLLRCIDAGHRQAEAARIFGVSVRTISGGRGRQAAGGTVRPQSRLGRSPRIGPAQADALADQIVAISDATFAEHGARWRRTTAWG